MIQDILGRLSAGQNLTFEEMCEVMDLVMQGRFQDEEVALLLTALRVKEETVEEIAGAAAALRRHMTPIQARRAGVIDTCGTGGDGSHTFNISTAAALVTAAAGVPVAKHGNRGITSRSGSAEVLAALGVHIEAPVEVVEQCLEEVGICFCFAPQLHPAMKRVAQVRRQLGGRTIFNLLGPLCNPARAEMQLLGVGQPSLRPRLAAALARLGTRRAAVVSGDDGMDEVTLSDRTSVTLIEGHESQELSWTPEEFGVARADRSRLHVDGPQASAQLIREVLAGQLGPPRDIVVLNAAAALRVADPEAPLTACAARAAEAIDSGAARDLLDRLIVASRG